MCVEGGEWRLDNIIYVLILLYLSRHVFNHSLYFIPICKSIPLHRLINFIDLSIYPPTKSSVYLSICLHTYLSIYVLIYFSLHLNKCLFTHLTIYLSIYPSIYPSTYPSINLLFPADIIRAGSKGEGGSPPLYRRTQGGGG